MTAPREPQTAERRITWRRVRGVVQVLEWFDGIADGKPYANCTALEQCTPEDWAELQREFPRAAQAKEDS